MRIGRYPITTQIKIILIFWAVSIVLITPILFLLVRFFDWPSWPIYVKVPVITLPMVIFMPPLGEYITRKVTAK
jgi:hypothetical protein